jgi:hypothetical protein
LTQPPLSSTARWKGLHSVSFFVSTFGTPRSPLDCMTAALTAFALNGFFLKRSISSASSSSVLLTCFVGMRGWNIGLFAVVAGRFSRENDSLGIGKLAFRLCTNLSASSARGGVCGFLLKLELEDALLFLALSVWNLKGSTAVTCLHAADLLPTELASEGETTLAVTLCVGEKKPLAEMGFGLMWLCVVCVP